MFSIILSHGIISRTELQKMCGKMSISTYNKLKPYLLEKYETQIDFDGSKQTFYLKNPETEEHQHVIEEFLKK